MENVSLYTVQVFHICKLKKSEWKKIFLIIGKEVSQIGSRKYIIVYLGTHSYEYVLETEKWVEGTSPRHGRRRQSSWTEIQIIVIWLCGCIKWRKLKGGGKLGWDMTGRESDYNSGSVPLSLSTSRYNHLNLKKHKPCHLLLVPLVYGCSQF